MGARQRPSLFWGAGTYRMELYSILSLLLVVAAGFAYLNHRFLRLPDTIGLMALTLLSSVVLVGLGRLGVPTVLRVAEVVRAIDFHTVLMQYMLSFLLFAGAMQLDTGSLGRQRLPVLLLATVGTLISTVMVGCTCCCRCSACRWNLSTACCLAV